MKDSVAGIDYRFADPLLLEQALTHRSLGAQNNERLEFLGDSVISLVVSERLFELRPESREGDLTRMRARLVRGDSLADIAVAIAKAINADDDDGTSTGFSAIAEGETLVIVNRANTSFTTVVDIDPLGSAAGVGADTVGGHSTEAVTLSGNPAPGEVWSLTFDNLTYEHTYSRFTTQRVSRELSGTGPGLGMRCG